MACLSVVGGAQAPFSPQGAISGVIAQGAKMELVKGGFQSLQGPVATPDGGLYFCDITGNRIYRLGTNGEISVWRENTQEAKGLFLLKDGRLLVAEAIGKRIIAVLPDGRVTVLAKGMKRPTDLIPDKKGGIYFTDSAGPARKLPGPEAVYYIRPTGELVLLDDKVTRPNGITLSLDEKTLYVADQNGEYVYAYDVQSDGLVKNKRPFVKLRESQQTPTGPQSNSDGMAIDTQGRLYVTTQSGVQVIDPRGKYLGTIRVPAQMRNVAFSGPRRRTLYLSS